MVEEEDFCIVFRKADPEFIDFILKKFKDKLPYKGSHQVWAIKNSYGRGTWAVWKHMKGAIHPRAMVMLHKDLTILRKSDPSIPTLPQLWDEYKKPVA